VIERILPYTGEEGEYPDRLLVVHIDKQWLVPTACICYADLDRTELLGKYVYTDVQLNVGLTDADFDRKANGL